MLEELVSETLKNNFYCDLWYNIFDCFKLWDPMVGDILNKNISINNQVFIYQILSCL